MLLITGGTGSLGNKLVEYYHDKFSKIIIYSRDEFKQFEMAKKYKDYDNVRFFIGDVRDKDRLKYACRGVDVVIHTAALKQVPAMEYNPIEAIKTNILGSSNVIESCIENDVKKAVLISTDKACQPVNLYGATKLAAEKLFISANNYNKTRFNCVRYGNVIGSRGSVIPTFIGLKDKGVTEFPITDLQMTRFWITLSQAVKLVDVALEDGKPEIYIPQIPSAKMTDIARYISPQCTFKEIGIRPGEKLHESLICENESVILVSDRLIKTDKISYTSDTNEEKLTEEEFNKLCERKEE